MTIIEAKERLREAGIASRVYSASYLEGGILTDAAGPIPHFKHSFAIDCQNDRWRCAFPRGNTDVARSFTLLEDAVAYVIRTIRLDARRQHLEAALRENAKADEEEMRVWSVTDGDGLDD